MRLHAPILLLIALSLIIGALTFSGYGESWDVSGLSDYAASTLSLYRGLVGEGAVSPDSIEDELWLGNYGPAYMVLVNTIDRLATHRLEDGLGPIQHLVSFITFQIGVAAFYVLALRWMLPTAAFGVSLLFATQPVLWGHAFINPKDIPFMTFFLLTVVAGLWLADRLEPIRLDRRTFLSVGLFWVIPFVLIFTASGAAQRWIEVLVRSAAAGGTNIFSYTASHITTAAPELYIERYSSLLIQASFFYVLLSIPLLLVYFRRTDRTLAGALIPVIAAGLVLGITVSIRTVGLLAGGLVAAFLLWKHRSRALVPLILYAAIAAAAVYIFWPYLWVDPAGRLVESVETMARFPWSGSVRFAGTDIPAVDLPPTYLPTMLALQLTEPVWLLSIGGLAAALLSLRQNRELVLLVLSWFVLPLTGLIVSGAVLYDNFRQLLFLLPPVFLLGGLAMDRIGPPALRAVTIALIAIPGIFGIMRLHPYEYVYYNSFAGGVQGAYRTFELDYWGTSYREAALWVNRHASPNAKIWAEGPAHLLGKYLREDLKLFSSYESERADRYEYVVALTRYDLDLRTYPDANVVHRIELDGAVLAVIKQP